MKIIITEKIADDGVIYLNENGFDVDLKYGISYEDLLAVIDAYDAIIVRSVTKVNDVLIDKAVNLKVVGRAGNGIDNIDVPACTQRGIIVVNTPESNIMAAAELAVGLAFAAFRNIPQANAAARRNEFRRSRYIGNELDGKTAGIIGLGRIGGIVATKLRGCNMTVVAYDPYITDERFKMVGAVKCETLDELLVQSDLITIHTPKTEETYGMIGEKELQKCRRGVRLVNAARGGLYNEKALYTALKEGQVASAALDVLEPEPNYDKKPEEQNYTNPLLELDNLVVTPHLGASTHEANYNVGTAITKITADALKGEMVPAVNMPQMKVKDLNAMKPYLDLAEMLGKIYYQAEKETVNKIEVSYSGTVADMETSALTLSVLKGFLSPVVPERVNYVNAGTIVRNMGIEVVESKSSHLEKYTNLITVKYHTKMRQLAVSGTVFAKDSIRVVDFFGYRLDFEPTTYIIAIQNIDRPGIIGQIGTILGANDINIAAMQWSRNRRGEKAVAFVSVDQEVGQDVLSKLSRIDGVLRVSKMRF